MFRSCSQPLETGSGRGIETAGNAQRIKNPAERVNSTVVRSGISEKYLGELEAYYVFYAR